MFQGAHTSPVKAIWHKLCLTDTQGKCDWHTTKSYLCQPAYASDRKKKMWHSFLQVLDFILIIFVTKLHFINQRNYLCKQTFSIKKMRKRCLRVQAMVSACCVSYFFAIYSSYFSFFYHQRSCSLTEQQLLKWYILIQKKKKKDLRQEKSQRIFANIASNMSLKQINWN